MSRNSALAAASSLVCGSFCIMMGVAAIHGYAAHDADPPGPIELVQMLWQGDIDRRAHPVAVDIYVDCPPAREEQAALLHWRRGQR